MSTTETKTLMTDRDLDRLRALASQSWGDLGFYARNAADTIAALQEQNRALVAHNDERLGLLELLSEHKRPYDHEAADTLRGIINQNERRRKDRNALREKLTESEVTLDVLKECDESQRGYLADYKQTIEEQRKALEVALGAPSESYPALLQRVRDLRCGLMSALEPNVYTDQLSAVREAAGISPGTAGNRWPVIVGELKKKAQRWDAAQAAPLNPNHLGNVLRAAWENGGDESDQAAAVAAHVRAHDAATTSEALRVALEDNEARLTELAAALRVERTTWAKMLPKVAAASPPAPSAPPVERVPAVGDTVTIGALGPGVHGRVVAIRTVDVQWPHVSYPLPYSLGVLEVVGPAPEASAPPSPKPLPTIGDVWTWQGEPDTPLHTCTVTSKVADSQWQAVCDLDRCGVLAMVPDDAEDWARWTFVRHGTPSFDAITAWLSNVENEPQVGTADTIDEAAHVDDVRSMNLALRQLVAEVREMKKGVGK